MRRTVAIPYEHTQGQASWVAGAPRGLKPAARGRWPFVRACLVSLALAATVAAQEVIVELKFDTPVMEIGEAVDFTIVCSNTGPPETPSTVIPEGLEVQLTSPTPSRSSRTTIINGRRSQRTDYVLHLRATALEAGSYKLGPFSIVADGKTYETETVKVVVRKAPAVSGSKGNQYIFAELDVTPRSLYVTEPYTATLTIGIRKVVIRGRTIPLNLLRSVLDHQRSDFSIFPGARATTSEMWLADDAGQRHLYEVFRIAKTVRAEEIGEARVGPIFLRANYPTEVRRGFFSSYDVTRARKETARAEAIALEIKGPTEQGRPVDFTGAVGKFTFALSATPIRVEQGKPITLTISIGGRPLEGIAGPDLTKHPELASRFDYTKEELIGDIERGHKVFRRAIFPKQPGEQTIPPISWSYFDPKNEKYVTRASKPIPIKVDPPAPGSQAITLVEQVTKRQDATNLTVLTGGISPNYVDVELALVGQAFVLTRPWMAALILPPVGWLILTLMVQHRTRLRGDIGWARRRRAQRDAVTLLHRASRAGTDAERWEALASALKSYLSDRFNLPPGELTPDEAGKLLAQSRAEAETVEEVTRFLEACNAVRYAPGALGTLSTDQAAGHIRRWIRRIERTAR